MKELSIQQHAALPDDEKGKYAQNWEKKYLPNGSDWQPCYHLAYEYHNNDYNKYKAYMDTFGYFDTRQVFRLIEQPVEEKQPEKVRKTCGEEDYGDCDCDNCIYNITV